MRSRKLRMSGGTSAQNSSRIASPPGRLQKPGRPCAATLASAANSMCASRNADAGALGALESNGANVPASTRTTSGRDAGSVHATAQRARATAPMR